MSLVEIILKDNEQESPFQGNFPSEKRLYTKSVRVIN